MFQEQGGRPGDRRGFLHKSFIGKAVGSLVGELPGIGTAFRTAKTAIGAVSAFTGKRPARPVAPRGGAPELPGGRAGNIKLE